LLPAALILGLHMDQHLTKKRFLLAAGIYTIAVVVVDPMGLVLLVLWLMAAFGLMLVKFVKRRPQSQAIAAHSDRRWPKAFAILATLGLALVLAATLYVTRDLRVHSDLGAASASATLPRSPEALGARPQYHATMTAHAMTAIPPEE
jgi:heme/copper-type cytochrome/quinol oxidase subunit 4